MHATLCSALSAQEPGKAASVTVELTNEWGVPAQNEEVQILPLPKTEEKQPRTDCDGKLSLEVPAGKYELTANLPGFVSSTKEIAILSGADESFKIESITAAGYNGCRQVSDVFPVSFPEQTRAVSPDGGYVVVDDVSDTEPYHTVFLEHVHTRRELFNFARHASILWNAASTMFAVTEYVRGSSSRCTVFSVDAKVSPIQVLDPLFRALAEHEQEVLRDVLRNRQGCVVASLWAAPESLTLEILGDGISDHPAASRELYLVNLHRAEP
jgi:hypothetical protein